MMKLRPASMEVLCRRVLSIFSLCISGTSSANGSEAEHPLTRPSRESRRAAAFVAGELKDGDVVGGDAFDPFEVYRIFEIANLLLDELDMKVVLFTDEGDDNDDDDITC
ncbi:hypothetical protein L1049_021014 [Liquidambar formosana]|uniref:Uncharacterized protein n=1 Tax=Liquidambar formosana TaxID=63359 RepID=A0AAP0SDW8_LIQFO